MKTEKKDIDKLIKNLGGEKETLLAACKLLARLLYKIGKKANATEIKFKIGDVYELKDYKSWGAIKVEWVLEEECQK